MTPSVLLNQLFCTVEYLGVCFLVVCFVLVFLVGVVGYLGLVLDSWFVIVILVGGWFCLLGYFGDFDGFWEGTLVLFLEEFGVCWFVLFPFSIETEKIRRILLAPLWLTLLEIKKTVGSPVPWRHKNSINTGLEAQLECLLSLDTWPVG